MKQSLLPNATQPIIKILWLISHKVFNHERCQHVLTFIYLPLIHIHPHGISPVMTILWYHSISKCAKQVISHQNLIQETPPKGDQTMIIIFCDFRSDLSPCHYQHYHHSHRHRKNHEHHLFTLRGSSSRKSGSSSPSTSPCSSCAFFTWSWSTNHWPSSSQSSRSW